MCAIDAINRQLAHYPYHIGQMIYAAKVLKNTGWQNLSIPKGESDAFNAGSQVKDPAKEFGKNEINLVGRHTDEAVEMTDKFLDDAFLAQVSTVRIVHGMGTGALRRAISELLTSHPHVSHFESAPPAEGGRGVTVVTLRD